MTNIGSGEVGSGGAAPVGLPSVSDISGWAEALAGGATCLSDADRIDLIRGLEVLKGAAEGAQAELTCEFDLSQRRAAAATGVPAERQGRGVASQVALARRESPHRAQIHVGLAKVLRTEMPYTWAALRAGRITEYRALLVARETACLELPNRQEVDARLAADADRIEKMGDRETVGEVRKLAYRLEPRSFVERRRQAEKNRHTRLRPAPDSMTTFTALLTLRNGVAMHAVLGREADRLRDAGDQRSRGQLMADLLVQRVVHPAIETGQAPGTTADTSLMVNLVVPDSVLLGNSDEGGWVEGFGAVPGDLLREWIADTADAEDVTAWVRRVYQRPASGDLVAMDSKARRFCGKLAEFLRLRDRACRTPWCDAPVRHLDHADDHANGGPTSARNAQGLCATCNHAKQARGWFARYINGPPDEPHTIETTTPTGHRHTSTAERVQPLARPRMDLYPLVLRVAS